MNNIVKLLEGNQETENGGFDFELYTDGKKYSVFFGFTDYTIDPIVNKKIPVGGGFGEKVFHCAVDAMAWIDEMLY